MTDRERLEAIETKIERSSRTARELLHYQKATQRTLSDEEWNHVRTLVSVAMEDIPYLLQKIGDTKSDSTADTAVPIMKWSNCENLTPSAEYLLRCVGRAKEVYRLGVYLPGFAGFSTSIGMWPFSKISHCCEITEPIDHKALPLEEK